MKNTHQYIIRSLHADLAESRWSSWSRELPAFGYKNAISCIWIDSKREVAVIFIFHELGVLLEWHKVNVGSWSYPEDAYTKFFGVPLYSGYIYSSVASYICRAWDHIDLKIVNWPHSALAISVGAIIYLNFFTNAFSERGSEWMGRLSVHYNCLEKR